MNDAQGGGWARGVCGIASGFFVFVAALKYADIDEYLHCPVGDPVVVLYLIGMAIFWLLAAIYCQHWAKK